MTQSQSVVFSGRRANLLRSLANGVYQGATGDSLVAFDGNDYNAVAHLGLVVRGGKAGNKSGSEIAEGAGEWAEILKKMKEGKITVEEAIKELERIKKAAGGGRRRGGRRSRHPRGFLYGLAHDNDPRSNGLFSMPNITTPLQEHDGLTR